MTVDIQREIEKLRERLLDLTGHNQLLNHRPTKRRSLEIVDELPNQIHEHLVEKGNSFRFEPRREAPPDEDGAWKPPGAPVASALPADPGSADARERRHSDGRLQTREDEESLEKRLKNMRGDARRVIEETGANHLFVSLGALRWHDVAAGRECRAPLILIPVELDRKFDSRSQSYVHVVRHNGEELQGNLSLAKKLEEAYGLKVPDYEDTAPEDYFAAVARSIRTKPDWAVERVATLGFFSFHKYLLYRDLDKRLWPDRRGPANHTLVRALIEGEAAEAGAPIYPKDYEVDDDKKFDSIEVPLDADSSQLSAIRDVADGKSLVIEGPPGTGKSQTISNVIAWALRNGKTVLFVAEKQAALEVVHVKLERLGLSALCLNLHALGARPAAVYEDLKRRLQENFASPRKLRQQREQLISDRDRLKTYLTSTKREVGPLREPLHAVFWTVAELRQRGLSPLKGAKLDLALDGPEVNERINAFDELRRHVREIGKPWEHPWRGYRSAGFFETHMEEIRGALGTIRAAAHTISDAESAFEAASAVRWRVQASSPARLRKRDLTNLDATDEPLVPSVCGRICRPETAKTVLQFLDLVKRHREWQAAATTLQERDVGRADTAAGLLKDWPARPGWSLANARVEDLRRLKVDLQTLVHSLGEVRESMEAVRTLGLESVFTVGDLERGCRVIDAVADPCWGSEIERVAFLGTTRGYYDAGRRQAAGLRDKRDSIARHLALADVPPEEELTRLRTVFRRRGGSFLRFLSAEYRDAKRRVLGFLASGAGFDPATIASRLEAVTRYRGDVAAFRDERTLATALGPSFRGIDTDWDAMQNRIQRAEELQALGVGYEEAARLRRALSTSSAPPDTFLIRQRIERARASWKESLCSTPVLGAAGAVGRVHPLPVRAEMLPEHLRRVGGDSGTPRETLHSLEQVRLNELAELAALSSRGLGDLLDALDAYTFAPDLPLARVCEAACARIEAAATAREMEDDRYRLLLDGHWAGPATDTRALERTLRWFERLAPLAIPSPVLEWLGADVGARAPRIRQHLETVLEGAAAWDAGVASLERLGPIDRNWLFAGAADFSAEEERLNELETSLDRLGPWSDYCRAIDRLAGLALDAFARAIDKGELDPDHARDTYRLSFYDALAEHAIAEDKTLAQFSRLRHEEARERFQQLDIELLKLNAQEAAYQASQEIPPVGVQRGKVSELTQMGLIKKEIEKQKRHCRLRQMIDRAAEAVQALKPCFMMSPHSVAQYLPPGRVTFDLVVMDEASQIKPEDALGAVCRGSQLVVVGDPKQLPPTSFFDHLGENLEADEDETLATDAESILEVGARAFPTMRRLRWHYRSQHESLIAFSNEKFYDDDLVVFPSPTRHAGRLGVRHHVVPGATCKGGMNIVEAEAVAKAIVAHALSNPRETLGVGTFNSKQRDLVADALDRICAENAAARAAVEKLQQQDDGLFIKNLENLQGDERDVIFIGYTYGPDPAAAQLYQRFGPINAGNGWRRLNVLVTRARRRVEVFASYRPEDIILHDSSSRGVVSMKEYLAYAATGLLVERGTPTGRPPESPFEIAVARIVEQAGLRAVPQVGVAGFRIDIGVQLPGHDGEYIGGIECDGASYHSAPSVRDRDRLREEVLKTRGWKLHRVWSTDWFRNQASEERRLRKALEAWAARAVPPR